MIFKEFLRLLLTGGPGFCQIAVTNACNAHCHFCSFPQVERGDRCTTDPARLIAGLEILKDQGIYYLCLPGGEPRHYPALLPVLTGLMPCPSGPSSASPRPISITCAVVK